MIPVRVPVNAPTYLVGGERHLTPEHPLYDSPCPVCDRPLEDQPITLVYVGMEAEGRKDAGWTNGAAVAVHVACTGPGATTEAQSARGDQP